MSAEEWLKLAALLVSVAVPTILAWVALWGRLGLVLYRINEHEKESQETKKHLADLWAVHNHQEGRLYMHDRLLVAMMQKMEIDPTTVDFRPKEKPHVRGNPRSQ